MFSLGDVVTARLPGVVVTKRRPAVVVSTDAYHGSRPDIIVAELTGQAARAFGPMEYALQDWTIAGLHRPSICKMFLYTIPKTDATPIGHLTDVDWQEVQARLRKAMAVT